MFDNAWLYNSQKLHYSYIYEYCTKLCENFVVEIDPVMRSLGCCCGRRKLAFTPLALYCDGKECQDENKPTIARDEPYRVYGTGSRKCTYCVKCWQRASRRMINVGEEKDPIMVAKTEFKLTKNDQIDYEPFIDCVDCGRKWHTICALHDDKIFPHEFV